MTTKDRDTIHIAMMFRIYSHSDRVLCETPGWMPMHYLFTPIVRKHRDGIQRAGFVELPDLMAPNHTYFLRVFKYDSKTQ